jgi:hypothetical protein
VSLVFGSEEWLAALGEELAGAPPLEGEGRLRLGQLILAADGSTVAAYTVELEGGSSPRLLGTGVEEAEVVLVESEAAGRALVSGAKTAAQLLEEGALKIRGDATALMRTAGLVEQAARSSGALAARTK